MPVESLMPSADAQPESHLVELLRAGRAAEAFDLVVSSFGPRLYRLCLALLHNHAEAEDAAQESLVRVWKYLARYDGRASLSTWIYAIGRNRCLTALGRRRHDLSLADGELAAQLEQHPAVASDGAGPPALLRELVEELPDRYRRCVLLYYYEEESVDAVGAMLGMPAGTVKTNLHRGRALLLQRLKMLGMDDARLWLESEHENC
jgi:RNA polymerase sigma-70 factor (ECF subfamily)